MSAVNVVLIQFAYVWNLVRIMWWIRALLIVTGWIWQTWTLNSSSVLSSHGNAVFLGLLLNVGHSPTTWSAWSQTNKQKDGKELWITGMFYLYIINIFDLSFRCQVKGSGIKNGTYLHNSAQCEAWYWAAVNPDCYICLCCASLPFIITLSKQGAVRI